MKNFRDYLEVVTEANLTKEKAIEDLKNSYEVSDTESYIWINTYSGSNKVYKNKMWKKLEEHNTYGLGYTKEWSDNFQKKIASLADDKKIKKIKIPLRNPVGINSRMEDTALIFKGTFSELLNAIK